MASYPPEFFDEPFLPPGEFPDPDEVDPDAAQEIGSSAARNIVTAMLAEADDSGTVVYRHEVPVAWSQNVPRKVGSHGTDMRMEFSVSSRKQSIITPEHEMVLAWHPYTTPWYGVARFKRPTKDANRTPDLDAYTSKDAALSHVEHEMKTDYWERGDYLTASFSKFTRLDVARKQSQENTMRDACWVFGMCRGAAALTQTLAESPAVKSMVEEAGRGHFNRHELVPAAAEQASYLSLIACKQALAGPRHDSVAWYGREVSDHVRQILENLLVAAHKRARLEAARQRPLAGA